MKPASSLSASRWLSAEFLVYYAYLSALFLFLLPRVTQVFTDACMRVFDCRRRLRPGWIPGRMLDASDAQWHEFRGSAIELLGGAAAFLALSHAIRFVMRGSRHAHTIRLAFYAATSLAFGVGVFGLRFAFPLALAVMSFTLGSLTAGTRLCPLATWAFSLALMFAIEWRTHWFTFEFVLGPRFAIWDAWPRPMLRWHVLFNMVQLRMISFNMDRHWAVQQRGSGAGGAGASDAREVEAVGAGELATGQRGAMALTQRLAAARGADAADSSPSKPRADPALPPAARSDYAVRERTARPLGDYTLLHFLLYAYYVPLQLAGPTITFNAFISQIRESQRTHSAGDKARYAARLVVAALLLDGLGHFVPVFALTSSRAFASPRAAFSPLDIGCLGYATINFMWLKFLIIWRFFRLWALLDGVETVENMNRCVNNNYTLSGFWRSWHRSFNRWLVRYIYVPLGGKHRRVLNIFVVFTFVALWHDMTMRLLAWAWLLGLFFIPEIVCTQLLQHPALRPVTHSPHFRHLVALGGACNIFLLMVANLVGFSVGTEGVAEYLQRIFTWEAAPFLLATFAAFFAAVQIMLEVRASEQRKQAAKAF